MHCFIITFFISCLDSQSNGTTAKDQAKIPSNGPDKLEACPAMPLKADMLDPIGAQPAAAAADLSFASKETVNVASPLAAVAAAAPISAAEAETATVIHINSPEDFYILPTACQSPTQQSFIVAITACGTGHASSETDCRARKQEP